MSSMQKFGEHPLNISKAPDTAMTEDEQHLMFIPFGTVLGVFTIIVLSKESVQRLYKISPNQTSQSTTTAVTPGCGG